MPDYKSNMSEVLKRVTNNLTAIKIDKKLVGEVALSLQASNIKRIHNDGKAVNGNQIGKYDKKPIYVNPSKSPRAFAPSGKDGKGEFKNGEKKKTKYFKEGYKGFRETNGRQTEKVDLSLSGKLSKEFIAEKSGNDYEVGFLTKRSSDIAEGNEERFDKIIWGVSKPDEEMIKAVVEHHVNENLNGRRTG